MSEYNITVTPPPEINLVVSPVAVSIEVAAAHTHPQSEIVDLVADLAAKQPLDADLTAIGALDKTGNGLKVIRVTADASTYELATISGGVGGEPSDGDKGDITVASSGTAWTIAADAVTYAKMQNVSATDKLLGRSTAGSGDVEEIACTAAGRALLDDANAAAQLTTLGAAAASHTHAQADVTNLVTDLAGKAASSHTHAQSDVTNLTTDLAGKQPLDSDLTAIAGLTATDDDFVQRKAGAWANRTVAQVKTDLSLTGTNSGDVTLAGTPDYITMSGQTITRGAVDLTTDVTGILPHGNLGTGGGGATKFLREDGTFQTIAAGGDVTGDDTSTTAQNIVAYSGTGGKNITELTGTQGDVLYHNGTNWAKLAAGTSGQFLKTNGAGANPAWAAASGGPTFVVLGSDVVNNNATPNTIADVTGLSFAVTNGVTYKFRFWIRYLAAADTTGARFSINGPAFTTLLYHSRIGQNAYINPTVNWSLSTYDKPTTTMASSIAVGGGSNLAIIEGVITPSADGTLIARFSSEVASSAITVKAGASFVEYQALS